MLGLCPVTNRVSRFIHSAACTWGVSSTTAFLRKRHHFPADFAFDLFRLVHVDAQLGRLNPPIPPRSTAKPLRTSLRLRWLSPAALRRFARSGVTTLHLVFRIRLLRKREPTEKRVTSGSSSLAGGKIPRSCHVPTLRVKTRSRAPVRRSAHSLSSCPAALDFVLDRRTWTCNNLKWFSAGACSAQPLVTRYAVWHSRAFPLHRRI